MFLWCSLGQGGNEQVITLVLNTAKFLHHGTLQTVGNGWVESKKTDFIQYIYIYWHIFIIQIDRFQNGTLMQVYYICIHSQTPPSSSWTPSCYFHSFFQTASFPFLTLCIHMVLYTSIYPRIHKGKKLSHFSFRICLILLNRMFSTCIGLPNRTNIIQAWCQWIQVEPCQ